MQNSLQDHSEESNLNVISKVQESDAAELGFFGGVETSPEVLGAEIVEGYDYGFGLGDQSFGNTVDEEVASSESAESEAEPATDEESLPDAWYGSFEDSPSAREALEVVIGQDDRIRIHGTTSYPWRAICSLRMETRTGKAFIGTGWLVGPRTIITAGHCVYFHNEGGWARSIRVIAGRNGSSNPYGICYGASFRSVTGWTRDRKRTHDYGAIILPSNCRLGSRVGYFGYGAYSSSTLNSKTLNLSGYPGDKGGTTQWFHSRRISGLTDRTIIYNMDSAGGQSGAPVWFKSGNSRYVVGIHTNGHSSGNSATRITKPVFDNIKAWKAIGL